MVVACASVYQNQIHVPRLFACHKHMKGNHSHDHKNSMNHQSEKPWNEECRINFFKLSNHTARRVRKPFSYSTKRFTTLLVHPEQAPGPQSQKLSVTRIGLPCSQPSPCTAIHARLSLHCLSRKVPSRNKAHLLYFQISTIQALKKRNKNNTTNIVTLYNVYAQGTDSRLT